jgi:hypothetical protein
MQRYVLASTTTQCFPLATYLYDLVLAAETKAGISRVDQRRVLQTFGKWEVSTILGGEGN